MDNKPLPSNKYITQCPGCSCVDADPTGKSASAFSVTVNGSDYEQAPYTIRDCTNCGLLYKDSILTDGALSSYYAGVDFRKWEIPGLFPTECIVVDELKNLAPGSSVLDVGCSSGRLLSALSSHYQRFGIEPNPTAAAMATSKGITILPQNDTRGGPFDAIVMVDVFEHLTSPTQTVASLAKRLKPGGKLIIVTGNGDNPLCREFPSEFWYFRNVEHVCMISRKFAEWLAEDIRLHLASWTTTSHYDSHWTERSQKWLRNVAWRHCQKQSWLWKGFLRFIPFLERARHWTNCPAYDLGKDHTVVVFEANSERNG